MSGTPNNPISVPVAAAAVAAVEATGVSAGARFAEALAGKDRDGLVCLLARDVDFQALTPGRHWASTWPVEIVDGFVLGHWFGPAVRIRGVRLLADREMTLRRHAAYQLQVVRDGADWLVEQQMYYQTDGDGRLCWVRLLCSGYQPRPVPLAD